jgi:hypothetical protein
LCPNWFMRDGRQVTLVRANVLGVGIHAIDLAEAVKQSERLLASGSKGYVCVTGVHGVMESRGDPSAFARHRTGTRVGEGKLGSPCWRTP